MSLNMTVPIRHLGTYALLITLLVSLFITSLLSGKVPMSLALLSETLLGQSDSAFIHKIIFEIRLPRAVTACFAGAALGVSGAVFQSIARNPLGSPDIIGFTTGAATGAISHYIFLGPDVLGIALGATAGGLAVACLVYLLVRQRGQFDHYQLILTGLGIGATLSAVNGLLLVKGNLDSTAQANFWLAGSLVARTWMHAAMVMAGVCLILPILLLLAKAAAILEMGDTTAHALGVSVSRTRQCLMICAVVLAALATGSIGPIAFVALAAPHLAKQYFGCQKLPVISSALIGAVLLIGADLLSQLLMSHFSLPVGRVAALLGGGYLIWLLVKQR